MNKMSPKDRDMQYREDRMMRKIRREARKLYELPVNPRLVMSDLDRKWQDVLRTPLGSLGTRYMTEALIDTLDELGLEIVKKNNQSEKA